jgi:hypothetical protein
MHSGALGTETFTVNGCLLHIRQIAAPSIAQSGYFIDVYT